MDERKLSQKDKYDRRVRIASLITGWVLFAIGLMLLGNIIYRLVTGKPQNVQVAVGAALLFIGSSIFLRSQLGARKKK